MIITPRAENNDQIGFYGGHVYVKTGGDLGGGVIYKSKRRQVNPYGSFEVIGPFVGLPESENIEFRPLAPDRTVKQK